MNYPSNNSYYAIFRRIGSAVTLPRSILLLTVTLTSLFASTSFAWFWEPYVKVDQMMTYAEGRRNVQFLNPNGKMVKKVWIETTVKTYPGNHAGVVFRGIHPFKYYYEVIINVDRQSVDLYVYEDGRRRELKRVRAGKTLYQTVPYRLAVYMGDDDANAETDDRIAVYLDGIEKINTNDGSLKQPGFVGTTTYYKGATFSNFRAISYDRD